MIVLKVTINDINCMSSKGICVCSYKDNNDNEVLGISIDYKDQFPDLEEIEVMI